MCFDQWQKICQNHGNKNQPKSQEYDAAYTSFEAVCGLGGRGPGQPAHKGRDPGDVRPLRRIPGTTQLQSIIWIYIDIDQLHTIQR